MSEKLTYQELVSRVKELEKEIAAIRQEKKILEDSEALQKNQVLLASTETVSKVGGWEWDVESQTMFWTDETYRIHGFDPDDLEPGSKKHIDKSIECYDPDDRPVILSAFKDCADKGKKYDFDFPFTKVTGERIWIRTIAKPVYKDDRIVKVIGNIMDVTDKKELEFNLRKNEKMYRRLVEGIPDIIYSYSTVAGGIYYSPNVQGILGYSPSYLLENPMLWHDSIHQDDLVLVDNVISRFCEGAPFEVEYRIKDSKGDWHWFIDRSFGHAKKNGEIIIKGVATDITKRKEAEEALSESEEKYRSFVENFQGIAFKGYEDFSVEFFTGKVKEITGYNEDYFISGRTMFDQLIHPDDKKRVLNDVKEFMSSSKKATQREYRIIDKKGKIHWIQDNIQKLYFEGKGKRGVIGLVKMYHLYPKGT